MKRMYTVKELYKGDPPDIGSVGLVRDYANGETKYKEAIHLGQNDNFENIAHIREDGSTLTYEYMLPKKLTVTEIKSIIDSKIKDGMESWHIAKIIHMSCDVYTGSIDE